MATSAAIQRAYRQRQRDGLRVFRLELDGFAIIDALIEAHRLTESEGLDHRLVVAAIESLLRDWADSVIHNGRDNVARAK